MVGEDVAVGQEQDARPPGGFSAQVPAALEQLPGNLEGDEGFAGPCGEGQQDAGLTSRHGLQDALDGDVLVVAARMGATLVLERHGGETVAPSILLAKICPQRSSGLGKAATSPSVPCLQVHAVDGLAVGGEGEPESQLGGVALGLHDALASGLSHASASTTASLVLRYTST